MPEQHGESLLNEGNIHQGLTGAKGIRFHQGRGKPLHLMRKKRKSFIGYGFGDEKIRWLECKTRFRCDGTWLSG